MKEEYRIPLTGEAKKQSSANFNNIDWSKPLTEYGRKLKEQREGVK